MSPPEPLSSKRILLACSALKFDALAAGLEAMGGIVIPFQALAVRPFENPEVLDRAIHSLHTYDWIIFTSAHAVLVFADRARGLKVPEERMRALTVCAVGPATAEAARDCGIPVSLVPGEFVAEGILRALAGRLGGIAALSGKRVLIPRALKAREILPRELASAGAIVEIAPCYETVEVEVGEEAKEAIRRQPPDLAVFTSSSNVAAFSASMGDSDARRLFSVMTVATLGPITAAALEPFGKAPEILPPENTIPALLEAIRTHYSRT